MLKYNWLNFTVELKGNMKSFTISCKAKDNINKINSNVPGKLTYLPLNETTFCCLIRFQAVDILKS